MTENDAKLLSPFALSSIQSVGSIELDDQKQNIIIEVILTNGNRDRMVFPRSAGDPDKYLVELRKTFHLPSTDNCVSQKIITTQPNSLNSQNGTECTTSPISSSTGRFSKCVWLGKGANASVFRAQDSFLNKEVALKVFESGDAPILLQVYTQEVTMNQRLQSAIQCPHHIPPIRHHPSAQAFRSLQRALSLIQPMLLALEVSEWSRDPTSVLTHPIPGVLEFWQPPVIRANRIILDENIEGLQALRKQTLSAIASTTNNTLNTNILDDDVAMTATSYPPLFFALGVALSTAVQQFTQQQKEKKNKIGNDFHNECVNTSIIDECIQTFLQQDDQLNSPSFSTSEALITPSGLALPIFPLFNDARISELSHSSCCSFSPSYEGERIEHSEVLSQQTKINDFQHDVGERERNSNTLSIRQQNHHKIDPYEMYDDDDDDDEEEEEEENHVELNAQEYNGRHQKITAIDKDAPVHNFISAMCNNTTASQGCDYSPKHHHNHLWSRPPPILTSISTSLLNQAKETNFPIESKYQQHNIVANTVINRTEGIIEKSEADSENDIMKKRMAVNSTAIFHDGGIKRPFNSLSVRDEENLLINSYGQLNDDKDFYEFNECDGTRNKRVKCMPLNETEVQNAFEDKKIKNIKHNIRFNEVIPSKNCDPILVSSSKYSANPIEDNQVTQPGNRHQDMRPSIINIENMESTDKNDNTFLSPTFKRNEAISSRKNNPLSPHSFSSTTTNYNKKINSEQIPIKTKTTTTATATKRFSAVEMSFNLSNEQASPPSSSSSSSNAAMSSPFKWSCSSVRNINQNDSLRLEEKSSSFKNSSQIVANRIIDNSTKLELNSNNNYNNNLSLATSTCFDHEFQRDFVVKNSSPIFSSQICLQSEKKSITEKESTHECIFNGTENIQNFETSNTGNNNKLCMVNSNTEPHENHHYSAFTAALKCGVLPSPRTTAAVAAATGVESSILTAAAVAAAETNHFVHKPIQNDILLNSINDISSSNSKINIKRHCMINQSNRTSIIEKERGNNDNTGSVNRIQNNFQTHHLAADRSLLNNSTNSTMKTNLINSNFSNSNDQCFMGIPTHSSVAHLRSLTNSATSCNSEDVKINMVLSTWRLLQQQQNQAFSHQASPFANTLKMQEPSITSNSLHSVGNSGQRKNKYVSSINVSENASRFNVMNERPPVGDIPARIVKCLVANFFSTFSADVKGSSTISSQSATNKTKSKQSDQQTNNSNNNQSVRRCIAFEALGGNLHSWRRWSRARSTDATALIFNHPHLRSLLSSTADAADADALRRILQGVNSRPPNRSAFWSRMDLGDLATVARQLFLVVASLHALGIAHCDIKPANLVFANKDVNPTCYDGSAFQNVPFSKMCPLSNPQGTSDAVNSISNRILRSAATMNINTSNKMDINTTNNNQIYNSNPSGSPFLTATLSSPRPSEVLSPRILGQPRTNHQQVVTQQQQHQYIGNHGNVNAHNNLVQQQYKRSRSFHGSPVLNTTSTSFMNNNNNNNTPASVSGSISNGIPHYTSVWGPASPAVPASIQPHFYVSNNNNALNGSFNNALSFMNQHQINQQLAGSPNYCTPLSPIVFPCVNLSHNVAPFPSINPAPLSRAHQHNETYLENETRKQPSLTTKKSKSTTTLTTQNPLSVFKLQSSTSGITNTSSEHDIILSPTSNFGVVQRSIQGILNVDVQQTLNQPVSSLKRSTSPSYNKNQNRIIIRNPSNNDVRHMSLNKQNIQKQLSKLDTAPVSGNNCNNGSYTSLSNGINSHSHRVRSVTTAATVMDENLLWGGSDTTSTVNNQNHLASMHNSIATRNSTIQNGVSCYDENCNGVKDVENDHLYDSLRKNNDVTNSIRSCYNSDEASYSYYSESKPQSTDNSSDFGSQYNENYENNDKQFGTNSKKSKASPVSHIINTTTTLHQNQFQDPAEQQFLQGINHQFPPILMMKNGDSNSPSGLFHSSTQPFSSSNGFPLIETCHSPPPCYSSACDSSHLPLSMPSPPFPLLNTANSGFYTLPAHLQHPLPSPTEEEIILASIVDLSKPTCRLPCHRVKLVDMGNAASFTAVDRYRSRYPGGTKAFHAPELLLRLPWSPAVDSWALGCLLFELFVGLELFGGRSTAETLWAISRFLTPEVFVSQLPQEWITSPLLVAVLRTINSSTPPPELRTMDANGQQLPANGPVNPPQTSGGAMETLDSWIGEMPILLVDLLRKLLHVDPAKRLSPGDALRHPWMLETVHQPLPNDIIYKGFLSGGDAFDEIETLTALPLLTTSSFAKSRHYTAMSVALNRVQACVYYATQQTTTNNINNNNSIHNNKNNNDIHINNTINTNCATANSACSAARPESSLSCLSPVVSSHALMNSNLTNLPPPQLKPFPFPSISPSLSPIPSPCISSSPPPPHSLTHSMSPPPPACFPFASPATTASIATPLPSSALSYIVSSFLSSPDLPSLQPPAMIPPLVSSGNSHYVAPLPASSHHRVALARHSSLPLYSSSYRSNHQQQNFQFVSDGALSLMSPHLACRGGNGISLLMSGSSFMPNTPNQGVISSSLQMPLLHHQHRQHHQAQTHTTTSVAGLLKNQNAAASVIVGATINGYLPTVLNRQISSSAHPSHTVVGGIHFGSQQYYQQQHNLNKYNILPNSIENSTDKKH